MRCRFASIGTSISAVFHASTSDSPLLPLHEPDNQPTVYKMTASIIPNKFYTQRRIICTLVSNYPVITAITAVITAILVFRVRKRLSWGNEEKQARSRITCEARAATNRVPASRASFASSCFGARSHARNITAVTGKLPENYRISPNRESNSVTRYPVI